MIPNGIDLARFKPAGEKIEKFLDGKVNILFVGRLDKRKGILYLLKAFQRLSSSINSRLLIVGDGLQRRQAKQFVRKNKLKNACFLGRVIKILLEDEALRKKLGEKGLKEVQKYSWEKVGEQILWIYQKALADKH